MTSKNQILYITESYSQQPRHLQVGCDYEGVKIASIQKEDVYIIGDPFPYYRGYDKDGRLLFQYKQDSVNVGMKPFKP